MVLSGNQALDPAGLAPAIVTETREKVTGLGGKNLRGPDSEYRNIANTGGILIPRGAASTCLLQFLPGQIDQIPLSIRA